MPGGMWRRGALRWAPLLFAGLLLATGELRAGCAAPEDTTPVTVTGVPDGDTVTLADGRHVRFIGINTPERAGDDRPAQPLAAAATGRLRKLLAGGRLKLVIGRDPRDHYGRLLAHPFLPDGTNLTARLLEAGLGFRIVVPPNLGFLDCYRQAEQTARQARRGVWVEPAFRPVPAASLTPDDTGFRRVSGTVTRVGESRTAWWLNLGRGFALRLPKKDVQYFRLDPRDFRGRTLTVRGWIYYVKKRKELRMNLRHPAMIEGQGTSDK